jgi:hypothetical protein
MSEIGRIADFAVLGDDSTAFKLGLACSEWQASVA